MSRPLVLPAREASTSTFQRWWNTQGEWVEEPNQRRAGESGVQRIRLRDPQQPLLYCKRQIGHLYRSWLHPFGRPTVLRELQALQAIGRLGVRVPEVVYCGTRQQAGQWQALLVTAELEGFISLEDWYQQGLGERFGTAVQERMLAAVGISLGCIHQAHWQHGCCYPKHIFLKVHGEGDAAGVDVALLDLEKSRRRLRRTAAARHDLCQLRRHRQAMPEKDWQRLLAAHRTFSELHCDV
ncbi:lipopolysaccharide kinase InaA family protein [Stutzerimonas xanthomarina]|uniref:lipopolysaccharide kinase InaA family protein n=1 Tax=Stutzerimonas xanthomarina TaxID=271420 RepID=UPI0029B6E73A|nr:lipopolysaccharide kinase InaA family protein [Stutzerimonas xanthomarina]MDX2354463.1 InaA protein [Stutzerimonas xanthomarina]